MFTFYEYFSDIDEQRKATTWNKIPTAIKKNYSDLLMESPLKKFRFRDQKNIRLYYIHFWSNFLETIFFCLHKVVEVKMATPVKSDPLAPFSLRWRGGTTPFPGLFHFILDPYLIMLSVKQGGIKNHFFWVFGMTQPGIEPHSPRPLANTRLNLSKFQKI